MGSRSNLKFAIAVVLFVSTACQRSATEPSIVGSQVCQEIPVGQAQAIYTSTAGVFGRYWLGHPTPETITATVPARFNDSENPSFDWTEKVNACLVEAAPRLRLGDRQLRIRIVGDDEANGLPPFEVEVLHAIGDRGHWLRWSASWSCDMITHEVFHWLGLVDTYPDQPSYACRAIGPTATLMHTPQQAWASGGALLTPAEFLAVTYPGCAARNPVYGQCAQNAYRASTDTCLQTSAACSTPAWTGLPASGSVATP